MPMSPEEREKIGGLGERVNSLIDRITRHEEGHREATRQSVAVALTRAQIIWGAIILVIVSAAAAGLGAYLTTVFD